jgi:integrase
MRLCEAVALHDEDIDLKAGLLTIRHTKFAKSRQVPLHASAIEALRRYWQMRDLAGTRQDAQAPFFITTRGQRHGMPLGKRQADRVFRRLCNELGWMNRGTHHAPRVHDLRHSFVVRRILLWQQQGVDIDQAMLSLSTYVGHVKVANTYWYLSAVPELMAVSARFFESCMPEVRHA